MDETVYIVTKDFQDRLSRRYYGIGSIYQGSPDQIEKLLRGGFITPFIEEVNNEYIVSDNDS